MIKTTLGTPASGMSFQPVKLLPVKPDLPRCPSCKAYIGINPVGEWSRCTACGTSFNDLDSRYKFAASAAAQLLLKPQLTTQQVFVASSLLLPNGKLIRKKAKVIHVTGQLSFFGGE